MAQVRRKRPHDPIQLAKLIGDIATGQVKDRIDDGKSARRKGVAVAGNNILDWTAALWPMKRGRAVEPAPSPFERFQQLARRLFAVPKKEVNEKLAPYEKRKRSRR
jgi:hypothetical protein